MTREPRRCVALKADDARIQQRRDPRFPYSIPTSAVVRNEFGAPRCMRVEILQKIRGPFIHPPTDERVVDELPRALERGKERRVEGTEDLGGLAVGPKVSVGMFVHAVIRCAGRRQYNVEWADSDLGEDGRRDCSARGGSAGGGSAGGGSAASVVVIIVALRPRSAVCDIINAGGLQGMGDRNGGFGGHLEVYGRSIAAVRLAARSGSINQ